MEASRECNFGCTGRLPCPDRALVTRVRDVFSLFVAASSEEESRPAWDAYPGLSWPLRSDCSRGILLPEERDASDHTARSPLAGGG
jgi:hypothetical protein